MKNDNEKMGYSLLALAVQGAMFAMFAMPVHAEEDELAALLKPTNTVEIGVANVSRASAKYGQFSGLNKQGADFVGNFSLNGGDSYGDGTGVRRWSFTGKDAGLTSRSFGAVVKDQGKWNIGLGYDELQNNISDSYQTPYVGAVGGNLFTLPAGFGLAANTKTMTAAQTAAFHNVDIASKRKNASVTAGMILNDQVSVNFDYNHLVQSGAKLAAFGSMLGGGSLAEKVAILPSPTNSTTDTVNLALNWIGDQAHLSTSYFGSFFREGADSVTFQTFVGANINQIMSTNPSNQLHQFNLNGGYKFSPQTQLTGAFSYGRNTQNAAYTTDAYSMLAGFALPQSSLNGLVNTYHADLKLTDKTVKDLVLSGGIKYDLRDDMTPSKMYAFNALDGAANHVAYFANTPYSNSKTQFELAGDYRLATDRNLRVAFNREEVKRWCNQYGTDWAGVKPAGMTTVGINSYGVGTNCVVATGSHDDKLSASYRMKANDDLNFNFGYSYAKRVTTSDPNAVTARIGLNGNLNPALVAATLIQGQNAGDFRGFYQFFSASRKEQVLKGSVNWQANEKLSLDLGGKITDDKYDSAYGVKKGSSWSVNVDANYAYSENGSVSAYVSQQQRQRDMTDLQVSPYTLAGVAATATRPFAPAGASWSDTQKDVDTTIGIGAKRSGLMDSKLEIDGDLTYTLGKTGYNTVLNYVGLTTGGLTCAAPTVLTCGALPTIQNNVIQLKLSGKYAVSKQSKVSFGYIYQQMRSNDFYYNGLQNGFTPTSLLPTNQQSPNYTVNVVTVSYIHDF